MISSHSEQHDQTLHRGLCLLAKFRISSLTHHNDVILQHYKNHWISTKWNYKANCSQCEGKIDQNISNSCFWREASLINLTSHPLWHSRDVSQHAAVRLKVHRRKITLPVCCLSLGNVTVIKLLVIVLGNLPDPRWPLEGQSHWEFACFNWHQQVELLCFWRSEEDI